MTMVIGRFAGAIMLVATLVVGGGAVLAHADERAPRAGTYSSMFFNGESGDINGDEIRIVATRNGYQGTVQLGRGEPTELILIKPVIDDDRNITFDFIDPSSGGHATFTGKITQNGLEGRLFGDAYNLKRAPSYWDTWRTEPP